VVSILEADGRDAAIRAYGPGERSSLRQTSPTLRHAKLGLSAMRVTAALWPCPIHCTKGLHCVR
jgi:hypothetical protein